ncbi:MAG: HPF/RaiA family ribosome-associated protein [Actinobacteria bacterium]|nr:MAG: HPF/RaiA family ribosome-associated protein [Actinomycetota bacterium]
MTERIEEPAPTNPEDLEINFVIDGPVPDAARDRARDMIQGLARKAPRPLLFARVKIKIDEDRPPNEDTIVQATVDVSGELIRAQVAAPTPGEALNTLGERMGRRVRRVAEKRRTARKRPPRTPEGEWRKGDLPSSRPGYIELPRDQREVIRQKTYAPEKASLEDALFDLDVLDYRFLLFTDELDGEDSVVYESDEGVMLRRLSGGERPDLPESLPIEMNTAPAPEWTVSEARADLDASNETFLFFRDASTGRGAAMYRRYDGHYGVIEPSV